MVERKPVQKSSPQIDQLLQKMPSSSASLDEILAKMETPVSATTPASSVSATPIRPLSATLSAPPSTTTNEPLGEQDSYLDGLLASLGNSEESSEKRPLPVAPPPPKRQKLNWCHSNLINGVCGRLEMPQVATFDFNAHAKQDIPNELWKDLFIKQDLLINGRIRQQVVEEYVNVRVAQQKWVIWTEISSMDPAFSTFCDYLVEKRRYGVVEHGPKVKDLYLIPVLPRKAFPIRGLGVTESDRARIIGIWVMQGSPSIPALTHSNPMDVSSPLNPSAISSHPVPPISDLPSAKPPMPRQTTPAYPMVAAPQHPPSLLNPELIGGLLAQLLPK